MQRFNLKMRLKVGSLQKLLIFLVILACVSNISSTQITQPPSLPPVDFPFERIIWTYWTSESAQPPIIVQLCIEQIAKVAQKHNFTFILVNQSNVRNYIQNYDQLFVEVRKNSVQRSFTHAADLLRMLIIEQNGGIWVDTTTIFLNGLTEIENIMSEEYRHLVVNRFSPRPEAMFFYEAGGQNRIEHKIADPNDPRKTILYNEYPDYEIWSIFAKKNSELIRDIRQTYSNFTVTPFIQTQQRFVSQDIYMSYIDNHRDYLYLNMAVSYTIQRKQLEFDQQLGIFSDRKYAFEHYKVWGLHGQYGPMLTTREDLLPYDYLFWYSKQDLEEMGFNFKFFMKQFGYIRKVTGEKFDLLLKYFDNSHRTFSDFKWNFMDEQMCQKMTFVVEGSIIDHLLRDSTITQKHRIPIITKEQNAQLFEHCAWKGTFFHAIFRKLQKKWQPYHQTISLYRNFYYKVHKGKVGSILHENQDLSIWKWVQIVWNDNFFLFYELVYKLAIAFILFGTYAIVRYFVALWLGENAKRLNTVSNSSFSMEQNSQRNHNKIYIRVMFLTFGLVVLNALMYSLVDIIGGRQQPETILFCVVVTFAVQAYIEDQIDTMKAHGQSYFSIESMHNLFLMMVNFMCGFLCMVHVWRNRFWVNWFACVLGLMGPSIFKLKKLLDENSQDLSNQQAKNKHQQRTLSNQIIALIKTNPHRCAILLFLALTILLPNLKYMAGPSGYHIKYASFIPLAYFSVVFLWTFLRCVCLRYWKEAIRLTLMILIGVRIYLTINEIDTIVQKIHRVSFFGMTFVVMSLMYVQIGSQVGKRLNSSGLFGKISTGTCEWVFMMLPLIVQTVLGLMWLDHKSMRADFTDYCWHWLFFAYSAILGEVMTYLRQSPSVSNQSNHVQSMQLQTFEEVDQSDQ